ncbi:MAG: glycosyltransferase [Salinivirgaceae bacterium]
MKILHITPSYKPAFIYGGPTISISMLCENQVKLGHDVFVLTTLANGNKELLFPRSVIQIIDEVPVKFFKRLTKDHTHFSPSLLKAVWQNCKKYDIVHIHSWWNLVAVFSTLLCLLRGVHPVLSIRGSLSAYTFRTRKTSTKALFHNLLGKQLIKRTIVHATTEKELDEIKEVVTLNKCFVIPNLIPLPIFNVNTILETKPTRIVTMARLHPVKNIEFVFQVLSQIKADFIFEIIGSGDKLYEQSLRNLTVELKIENKVIWHGWKKDNEKDEILRRGHFFILMSKTENFGNALIEAMCYNLPVLVSDKVGLANYIFSNKFGWVIPLKEDDLIKMLNEILKEKLYVNYPLIQTTIYSDFNSKNLAKNYISEYIKV